MNRNPYTPPVAAVEDIGEWRPLAPVTILGRLEHEDFGGFWLRVLATFIDGVIMYPFQEAISYVFSRLANLTALSQTQLAVLDISTNQIIFAAYTIGLWASPWQATIGKRLCGLVVVSDRLDRLSLARAAVRYLATGLSALLIVGVLTIPASERRRALHDMLVRTLVVKRRSLERAVASEY